MSDPHAPAPSHGHPSSDISSTRDKTEAPATASHPSTSVPDPTVTSAVNSAASHRGDPFIAVYTSSRPITVYDPSASPGVYSILPQPVDRESWNRTYPDDEDASKRRFPTTVAPSTPEFPDSEVARREARNLSQLKNELRAALRQYPDFPSPGILFEDIMPIFASPQHLSYLNTALTMQVIENRVNGHFSDIDIIVGLESRGFLFGPTLALSIGAGFVPVRKQGKLPGKCETVGYKKEYGEDFFQMQSDAFPAGKKVLIVDDIIATGGSAAAAGSLVKKLGGDLIGYLFIMELDFLKGREKLEAPVWTLLSGQEE